MRLTPFAEKLTVFVVSVTLPPTHNPPKAARNIESIGTVTCTVTSSISAFATLVMSTSSCIRSLLHAITNW